jgi:hypothetical protein
MKTYFLVAIVCLGGTAISFATPFGGSADSAPANPAVYGDQSSQLQIYASPSSYSATNVPQNGLGMSTDSDWTVSVDVNNSAHSTSNDMISLGAYSLDMAEQETAGLSSAASEPTGEIQGTSFAGSKGFTLPELLVSNGTVRVSYTATNQVLEIAYATASTNSFQPLLTRDTSDWPAMKDSGFVILLDAEPAGEEPAPGDAFLDNLTISLGTSPAWTGNRLPDGSMELSATGGVYRTQGPTNAFGTKTNPSLSR